MTRAPVNKPPRRQVRPRTTPTPPRAALALAAALGLARLLPTAVRLLRDWSRAPAAFVGDFAVLDLYLQRGLRGALWLGPYSRYGWHHPGPLWLYAMLPAYALSGRAPIALVAWNLSLSLAALALSVALLARRVAAPALALFAALLALLVPQLGEQLVYPWNPFVIVAPFLLLLVVATRAVLDGWRWAPPLVLLHAFLAQTHLGVLPASTACAGAALAALALLPSHRGLARPRWALPLTLATFAVLWAPVLVEQLRDRPGNLTRLARFFSDPSHPAQPWDLALVAWARVTFGLLLRPLDVAPGVPLAAALGVITAAAFALGLRAAARRRDPLALCLCGFSLLALVGGLLSARAVVGDIRDYLLAWSTVATLPGLVGLAHLASSRATDAWLYAAAALLGLGALPGAASTVRGVPIFDPELARSVAAVATAVDASRGRTIAVAQSEHDQWPDMAAVVDQLSLRGHRVSYPPDWSFMLGDAPPPTPPGATVLLLSPALPRAGSAAGVECLARAPRGWRSLAVAGPREAICVATPR